MAPSDSKCGFITWASNKKNPSNRHRSTIAQSATFDASVTQWNIDSAQKHACDLIVMASHGRRGLARVLLGSETQHVLTHTQIPVLVIR